MSSLMGGVSPRMMAAIVKFFPGWDEKGVTVFSQKCQQLGWTDQQAAGFLKFTSPQKEQGGEGWEVNPDVFEVHRRSGRSMGELRAFLCSFLDVGGLGHLPSDRDLEVLWDTFQGTEVFYGMVGVYSLLRPTNLDDFLDGYRTLLEIDGDPIGAIVKYKEFAQSSTLRDVRGSVVPTDVSAELYEWLRDAQEAQLKLSEDTSPRRDFGDYQDEWSSDGFKSSEDEDKEEEE